MTYGELFIKLRRILGVNQTEFARIIGASHQSAIARIENHRMPPKATWLVRAYLIEMEDREIGYQICDLFNEFHDGFSKFYGGPKQVLSSAPPVDPGRPRGKASGANPKRRRNR